MNQVVNLSVQVVEKWGYQVLVVTATKIDWIAVVTLSQFLN